MASKSIHISDLYECNKIDLACELYYVCELGKYLYYNYNKRLSLKGVELSPILRKSDIWVYLSVAQANGWVVDIKTVGFDLKDINALTLKEWKHYALVLKNVLYTTDMVGYDKEDNLNRRRKDEWQIDGISMNRFRYDLTVPRTMQVCFSNVSTHNRLIFALDGKYSNKGNDIVVNNASINGFLPQFSWLSLIAYVAVMRLMEYNKELLSLSLYLYFNNTLTLNEMSLAYFLILNEKSNCFAGWVYHIMEPNIPQRTISHLGYVAWYKEGLDKGYLATRDWYDSSTKIKLMKKLGIGVNDVVLFFERKELQKKNHIKEIIDMKVAIVERITEQSLYLNIISTTNLRYHSEREYLALPDEIKQLYSVPPYTDIKQQSKRFDWIDMGVQYAMVDETYFILPLNECEGVKKQWVSNEFETLPIILSQNDFIYWLFEDYNVPYNKEHFLAKYFKDTIPLYQSFMIDKDTMPTCYIDTEELG